MYRQQLWLFPQLVPNSTPTAYLGRAAGGGASAGAPHEWPSAALCGGGRFRATAGVIPEPDTGAECVVWQEPHAGHH